MKVRIFDIDQTTEEMTFRAECDLRECYPDDQDQYQYYLVRGEIQRTGVYWEGGGAAPLILLMGDS